MDAFCFRHVFNKLPTYVVENVVREWCEPLGAIRYISHGHYKDIYVDVKEWLPKGFEMRDMLITLRAMGTFDKEDIPKHPLKFGRYLLVLPSYTLLQHDEFLAQRQAQQMAQTVQAQTVQMAPFFWHFDGPVSIPWNPEEAPEVVPEVIEFTPSEDTDDDNTTDDTQEMLSGYVAGIELD